MSWAVWIMGRPATLATALAAEAAARLGSRGASAVILHREDVQRVLVRNAGLAEGQRDALDRALAYVAATLADSGVPVIIDAPDWPRKWGDLARAVIPRFAEVRLASAGEAPAAPQPELLINPVEQEMGEAAGALVELVRGRFLSGAPLPPTRSLGEEALRRWMLPPDTAEQKEIGRRALAYAAELLGEAETRRRRASARS